MVITIQSLMSAVLWLIVGGLIAWLLLWLVKYIGPPEPVQKVATALIVIVMVLWLINVVLTLMGHPFIQFR